MSINDDDGYDNFVSYVYFFIGCSNGLI